MEMLTVALSANMAVLHRMSNGGRDDEVAKEALAVGNEALASPIKDEVPVTPNNHDEVG
jgi:hypothetical protein